MMILLARVHSAWGPIYIAATNRGLAAAQMGGRPSALQAALLNRFPGATIRSGSSDAIRKARRQLREYFAGRRKKFRLRIDWSGLTEYQKRVLHATLTIPYGKTRTYGEVARAAGRPQAARAAGGAVGANPLAPVVPCHRVITARGGLGGYSGAGGVKTKKKLLDMERTQ